VRNPVDHRLSGYSGVPVGPVWADRDSIRRLATRGATVPALFGSTTYQSAMVGVGWVDVRGVWESGVVDDAGAG